MNKNFPEGRAEPLTRGPPERGGRSGTCPVVSATVLQGAILPNVEPVAHATVVCATPFYEGKTGFVAHNHLQQDIYPCSRNGDGQATLTGRPEPIRPAAITPHGRDGAAPMKTAFI